MMRLRSLSSAIFRFFSVVRTIYKSLMFGLDSMKATKLFLKVSKNMRIMVTDIGFFLPMRLAKEEPTNLALSTYVEPFSLF